ncbi:MAG: hypothetical protein ACR2Q4_01350, partial [Geminicoccaceae bacterium]
MPTNQSILPRNDHPQVTAATVIGKSPSGQLIVATNGLQLKIEQSIDLPVGAELQLTFVTVSAGLFGATNAETVSHRPNPLTVLVEILEDVDNAGRRPVDVEQPTADRLRPLPMPDRNLAAKLLGLLALSVESDFVDSHLSARDDPHASRQAKERLQTAVIELARLTTEPLADDWQGLKLPIGLDSNQAVCIFHRDHHQEQD